MARGKELPTKGGSYIRRKDGSLHRLTPDEEESLSARGRKTFSEAVDETLADERLSADAVFDRIKVALGADSDAHLAWIFGKSPASLSNRRKRNSVPYREAVFVALWAHVSLDYLLTGKEGPQ